MENNNTPNPEELGLFGAAGEAVSPVVIEPQAAEPKKEPVSIAPGGLNNLVPETPVDTVLSVTQVNQTNIEQAMGQLPEKIRRQVTQLAQSVNLADSQSLLQYGVGIQTKIASFSDGILAQVRNKDNAYVGEIMSRLSSSIGDMDTASLVQAVQEPEKKRSFFGGIKKQIKKFTERYEKVGDQIETISNELDKARIGLLKDVAVFDSLYDKNLECIKELDLHILAAVLELKHAQEELLPQYKAKAEQTNDPLDLQRYNDFAASIDRFEKKLQDLRLSRTISIQSAPQIRLVQDNNKQLIEKIQTSILTTIPLWKSQIVIALGLFRQRSALDMQKKVTQTTNDLLRQNSELLKQNTIETARETQAGIVELETLKTVNENLISTIDEAMRIQTEGREKRQLVEKELISLENDLKTRMLQAK